MHLIAGYAYAGAWLGGVLGLCRMAAHLGAVDASAVLGLVGALLGAHRARRATEDPSYRGSMAQWQLARPRRACRSRARCPAARSP